jgi:UMP-CMP kinase
MSMNLPSFRFSFLEPRFLLASRLFSSSSSSPPFLFVMGPPGSGKGTQSSLLIREFGHPLASSFPPSSDSLVVSPSILSSFSPSLTFPFHIFHLSVGYLLRCAARSSPALSSQLSSGLIVPGKVSVELIEACIFTLQRSVELSQLTQKTLYLIDGFPRNEENVNEFQNSHLWRSSNRSFSILQLNCSEQTTKQRIEKRSRSASNNRSDDAPHTVQKRINTYLTDSLPVLNKIRNNPTLGKLYEIDAEPEIEIVYEAVKTAVKQFMRERN